ncbi:MAG: hypothetical protein ACJAS4_001101 [Bacteriovoracaceae bacterium]|jgi:hypothetical protein
MKINKIVTITLFNSFVLLVFASLLASCQKNNFAGHGLLSKWETASRSIASIDPQEIEKFKNFQDTKQIMIFCELNSAKVKSCYKDQFAKLLNRYSKKYPRTKSSSLTLITNKFSYENVKEEFEIILSQIYEKTNPKLDKLVSARKNFCEKNSEYYLEKCLTQYIEKDTFSVLNQFHGQNKMNGHEYLYLKNIIKSKINKKLIKAKITIEKSKSTI